jgi:hypothetical protein
VGCVNKTSGSVMGSKGFPSEGPRFDAFSRLRISEPHTILESKQLYDNQPLIWDDQQTAGAGTTSTHSTDRASTTIAVSNLTAGTRVRQTFMRPDYQPGKSQLTYMTTVFGAGAAGITKRVGQFDANNGLFYELDGTDFGLVRRTYTSGAAVDNRVEQADWNLDRMDGTGRSGLTLDLTNVQLLIFDCQWLGGGLVRMGFMIGGQIYYAHEFVNANELDVVYMSTPNNPLRYEIANDGTGPAATLEHISSTVVSEGGRNPIGILRYGSTDGTHVDANAANTIYALVGIRLKAAYIGARIEFISAGALAETADDFEWIMILNPTVAGVFAYASLSTESAIEIARGALANTVTGGTPVMGGWGNRATERAILANLENALVIGAAIDGTPDEMVLCARPLSANLDIQGSLSWRETL